MESKGEVSSVKCLIFRRFLPGPIEKVWAHLTDTAFLPAWFGENSSIEGRQGGAVRLMGGHIRGVVTQWQPPKKLVYTWNVFDPKDEPDAVSAYPESYPTFELEPLEGNNVILTFTHFPIPEKFVPQSAMGWHTMLDILRAALNGEATEGRAVYMGKNAELYNVDLNNLAR
ncbi:MAG: SRPBCC domain-containing protein [Pirellulaceae bacterium]